jgi:hypothetical protein
MHSSPAALLHEWHEFFVLVGTASATLVGLMFVAASIGASIFSHEHRAAMKAFISPTVVHFSAVMFICIVALVPSQTWTTLAGLTAAGGLAGLAYSGRVWVQLFVGQRFKVDLIDRLFYALVPVAGYVLVLAAAVLLFRQSAAGDDVLAAALITLLLAGIRNAWDMTMWIVIRTPASGTGSETPP